MGGHSGDISAILTHGANALRTKAAAEDALAILAAHGWTVKVSSRPRIIKAIGGAIRRTPIGNSNFPKRLDPLLKLLIPLKFARLTLRL
jgi:hypothetical protein